MTNEQCPVAATIAVIGGKWKPIILYLVSQLRELETDGIIHREVFPVIPPKVQYTLTEKEKTLRPVILAMREWGLKNAMPC
jgi:DNA-binding HxlR family transcriptional regulator